MDAVLAEDSLFTGLSLIVIVVVVVIVGFAIWGRRDR